MMVISETRRATYIGYLRFYYYHWVDTSADNLLITDGIILPVVSDSALTWFIRYILYLLLKYTVLK